MTINDVTCTSRSPPNNEFTIQVHGRPILFISTETTDPNLTDPSQLLIVLRIAENIRYKLLFSIKQIFDFN